MLPYVYVLQGGDKVCLYSIGVCGIDYFSVFLIGYEFLSDESLDFHVSFYSRWELACVMYVIGVVRGDTTIIEVFFSIVSVVVTMLYYDEV